MAALLGFSTFGACASAPQSPLDAALPIDAGDCPTATDHVPHAAPHTPRWAFDPWISKDISDTDDTYAFVDGFRTRDIPVGTVVLDSPWETQYNTFVPNPIRYHDFARLSTDLHGRGVRLVLWITQLANSSSLDLEAGGDKYGGPSPNYAQGARCGFFVNQADQFIWWKGIGSGVDFFSSPAVAWWHRQQDSVLPLIDGWKLDFGDSYVLGDTLYTAQGEVPHQAYSEAYYRDYRDYAVKVRGADFVTLARGWDQSYGLKARFYARPEDAPLVWAGDNRRDTVGLADALDTMFRSSNAGYIAVGSDVGGYLDVDDKTFAAVAADFDVFARWTAVGALTPFMQLHGRANLTPWTLPDRPGHDGEMLTLYRYWSTLHHELVPFFYSLSEEAQAGHQPGDPAWQSIVRPVGDDASWPGDYRFGVGDAFLVAPLLDGDKGTHRRDVALPAGATWVDWWAQDEPPIVGGTVLKDYAGAVERPRLPLFVREGAIVPLQVSSPLTGLGSAASHGRLTVLIHPGSTPSHFALHDEDGATLAIAAQRAADTSSTVTLGPVPRPTILRIRTEIPPVAVSVNAQLIPTHNDAESVRADTAPSWYYDASLRSTWILLLASANASTVVVR